MTTIEITLYKFSELSEKAQAKALADNRDINTSHNWYDFIFEDAKAVAALMGIEIETIHFAGFWSQGDGACFEGSYSYQKDSVNQVKAYAPEDTTLHQIAARLQAIQKPHFYTLSANVKHSGHYYHENCTQIEVRKDGCCLYSDSEAAAADELGSTLRSFMKWIYRMLENEYDQQTSDQQIKETLEANDYDFTADGKMYH